RPVGHRAAHRLERRRLQVRGGAGGRAAPLLLARRRGAPRDRGQGETRMKTKSMLGLAVLAVAGAAWWLSAPPEHIRPAPAYRMGEISAAMQAARVPDDLAPTVSGLDLPGHDDV